MCLLNPHIFIFLSERYVYSYQKKLFSLITTQQLITTLITTQSVVSRFLESFFLISFFRRINLNVDSSSASIFLIILRYSTCFREFLNIFHFYFYLLYHTVNHISRSFQWLCHFPENEFIKHEFLIFLRNLTQKFETILLQYQNCYSVIKTVYINTALKYNSTQFAFNN